MSNKDASRGSRLSYSWSKQAESRLKEELKHIALKNCDDKVKEFVACSQAR
ncbi:unnamed protein product, partial [Chrysoparadoxa australica]